MTQAKVSEPMIAAGLAAAAKYDAAEGTDEERRRFLADVYVAMNSARWWDARDTPTGEAVQYAKTYALLQNQELVKTLAACVGFLPPDLNADVLRVLSKV